MLLCWISVMFSKPISFTAFSVLSLTDEARDSNVMSSKAPGWQKERKKKNGSEKNTYIIPACTFPPAKFAAKLQSMIRSPSTHTTLNHTM